jgi:hypothetical protein
MLRRVALILVMSMTIPSGFVAAPAPAAAQDTAAAEHARIGAALLDAFDITEIMAILRLEGLDYAETLGADLLGGRGGQGWARAAERIYAQDRMQAEFTARFIDALPRDADLLALALDFYASPRGQTVIGLENAARRAMLDDDIDDVAHERAAELLAAGDPRMALIGDFIRANDYIDSNVAGGLNANFAFYLGLRDSGAPEFDISENEMLADVWAQEGAIRAETEEWLYAYLSLAYQPLSDDDLRAYTAFSETQQAGAVTRALFVAFDGVFNKISRDLGFEAGRVLSQQDL